MNVHPNPNPWACPSCQFQWPGSARFCASCGEPRLPVARGALGRAVACWWLTVRQRDRRRQGLVPPLTNSRKLDRSARDTKQAEMQAAKQIDSTRFSDAFDLQQQTLAKASVVAMVPLVAMVFGIMLAHRFLVFGLTLWLV